MRNSESIVRGRFALLGGLISVSMCGVTLGDEPRLYIEPIPGLTTVRHPAPAETSIPLGTMLRVCVSTPSSSLPPNPDGDDTDIMVDPRPIADAHSGDPVPSPSSGPVHVTWTGAVEIDRSTTMSWAECPLETEGVHVLRVMVERPNGGRWETSCALNVVDVPGEEIAVGGRILTLSDPMRMDESATNEETMRYFFGESIASLRVASKERRSRGSGAPRFPTLFLTSTDNTMMVSVRTDPPGFEPLMEVRIGGREPFLAPARSLRFAEHGLRRVSLGPTQDAIEFDVQVYRVSIVSHRSSMDIIPEGEPITFEAVTDPPGYEDEITWLSSTKYGTGTPVTGRGPTFTVRFDDTWGPHPNDPDTPFQWLGVKADNAVFNQDQKCPGFISRADAGQLVIDTIIVGHPNAGELVAFSYPIPLSNGSIVQPSHGDGGGPITVNGCAWLYYIDFTPGQQFEHSTRYVLVGGTSIKPSVDTIDQAWWPRVNGQEIYTDPEENAISGDLFWGSYPGQNPVCVPEPFSHYQSTSKAARMAEKLWGITFIGPGIYLNDRTVITAALKDSAAVPQENIKGWSFDQASVAAAVQEANDNNATLVYVYIATHLVLASGKLSTRSDADLSPAELAALLDDLKACSVFVILQGCFTGKVMTPVLDALMNRAHPLNTHEPPTIGVFTSSSETKRSFQHSGPGAGSYWTQGLKKCWGDNNADSDGNGSVDVFETFNWVLINGCADARVAEPQWDGFSYMSCGS